MNISDEEKDFLFLMDYVESGLAETPWHTNKWELPTAANGFRGQGRSGGSIRGKKTIRGKSNIR